MTLCGAILNLALHRDAFTPSIVLVDEASQIPLCLGAAIGGLEGGTYVFIGDNRQMPPIFHENMVADPMSISIFEHLQSILPRELKTILTTTYRMNSTICSYVSKQFYEPYGITLSSHASVANNHIRGENLVDSIEFINIDTNYCEDCNYEEAKEAVKQALKYKQLGLEVSIITPYRKQVNLVREELVKVGGVSSDILIDTVERLQGQDVDVIILTMSASDIDYYKTQTSFLLNKNRLNVMISRAKLKVIVIKSPIVLFM
jgi:DNA replication ATP-dependent helicase Dna2